MNRPERWLAVYPTVRGFAFMVTEGLRMIDYGNICHADYDYLIERYKALYERYGVDRLITEKFTKDSRRGEKARRLVGVFRLLAKARKVACSSYSKAQIEIVFEPQGAFIRHQRAKAVCEVFTSLHTMLPRPRKPWEGEHLTMHIFDCAVLTLAHEYHRRS